MSKLQHSLMCLALLCTSSAANAGIIYFAEPVPITANSGEVFSLHVRGKDFPVGLDGGGLEIAFDTAVLRLDAITVDALWDFMSDGGSIDNTQGMVTDIFFNSAVLQGVSGDFPILSVRLSATGLGTGFVNLEPSEMFPFAGGGDKLAAEFSQANVSIATAVPEPEGAAAILSGLAILCLFLARSRKRP